MNISKIVYENGYNEGLKTAFKSMKTTNVVLCILVAFCLVISTVTAISVAKFANETRAQLQDLSVQVETIATEFKDLALSVSRLEQNE